MRTIGSRTNVLFIVAAAFGLLASLGRPWYAQAPAPVAAESGIGQGQSPAEGFIHRITRELSWSGGTQGWDAFTTTDAILAALVAITVVCALGSLVPAIEQPCREILRLVTLAMLGIVVVKLVNTPDALVERRQGVWIALGVTGIMAVSGARLSATPLRRSTAASSGPRPRRAADPGSQAGSR